MDSNLGEKGVESIRLNGLKPENLPLAERASALSQLVQARAVQNVNRIRGIRASSPKQSVAWVESRIETANKNATDVAALKSRETALIAEYSGLISMCRHRDKLIERTTDEDEIQKLKKDFPLYDVEAMERQIVQSKEAIERCDGVIAREYKDIADLQELLGLCRKRDADIKALGG